jgi:chemotaxis protein CheX
MSSVNAIYVNSFASGAISVLAMLLGEQPNIGKPAADVVKSTSHQVNVILGVTGEAQGSVLIGMSLTTADRIASKMIGQPIISFDNLAASAICEMANMICGSALNNMCNAGHACDITPPTLIRGQKIQISNVTVPSIHIPMEVSIGQLVLSIALESKPEKSIAA